MSFGKVRIRRVTSPADRKTFVKVPWNIYKDDPRWVPPLILDRLESIDEKKNPFFEHGKAAYFIAEQDGIAVGRVSAHRNYLHNEYHQDRTGFSGFFESTKDPRVSRALLETAEGWLRAEGCDQVLGPQNFSTNQEETGLLVEDRVGPPMIMCSYNPPYYKDLWEEAGYEKAKDLLGWHYEVGKIPEAPQQIADAVERHPGLTIRPMDRKNLRQEAKIVGEIFNEAWAKNWGYVPWTENEVDHAAKMMKLILIPEFTAMAEVDGKPAGMMLILPNILEVLGDLNGRLLPTGIFKLVRRLLLKGHKFQSVRLVFLGIKPEFRGSALGGLSVLLYVLAHRKAIKYGVKVGELGWTLEDNEKINTGIQFMGGTVGKVYRVYGKAL